MKKNKVFFSLILAASICSAQNTANYTKTANFSSKSNVIASNNWRNIKLDGADLKYMFSASQQIISMNLSWGTTPFVIDKSKDLSLTLIDGSLIQLQTIKYHSKITEREGKVQTEGTEIGYIGNLDVLKNTEIASMLFYLTDGRTLKIDLNTDNSRKISSDYRHVAHNIGSNEVPSNANIYARNQQETAYHVVKTTRSQAEPKISAEYNNSQPVKTVGNDYPSEAIADNVRRGNIKNTHVYATRAKNFDSPQKSSRASRNDVVYQAVEYPTQTRQQQSNHYADSRIQGKTNTEYGVSTQQVKRTSKNYPETKGEYANRAVESNAAYCDFSNPKFGDQCFTGKDPKTYQNHTTNEVSAEGTAGYCDFSTPKFGDVCFNQKEIIQTNPSKIVSEKREFSDTSSSETAGYCDFSAPKFGDVCFNQKETNHKESYNRKKGAYTFDERSFDKRKNSISATELYGEVSPDIAPLSSNSYNSVSKTTTSQESENEKSLINGFWGMDFGMSSDQAVEHLIDSKRIEYQNVTSSNRNTIWLEKIKFNQITYDNAKITFNNNKMSTGLFIKNYKNNVQANADTESISRGISEKYGRPTIKNDGTLKVYFWQDDIAGRYIMLEQKSLSSRETSLDLSYVDRNLVSPENLRSSATQANSYTNNQTDY